MICIDQPWPTSIIKAAHLKCDNDEMEIECSVRLWRDILLPSDPTSEALFDENPVIERTHTRDTINYKKKVIIMIEPETRPTI